MFKKILQNIVLLVTAIILCLAFSEAAIRLMGKHDADGNFCLFNKTLRPYKCPVVSVEEAVRKYLSKASAFVSYDPDLGWSPRPLSKSENGLFMYNSEGIRCPSCDTVIPRTPRPGVLRIAIFGDSFTHGDEVTYEQTWGYALENTLKSAGVDAEVINFGFCGYGMDQAYLRWKKTGRLFSPDIVIFGFQPENLQRNVNIIRLMYRPTDEIFFSKPRFIISGGALKLLNVPCIDPQRLVGILQNLNSWDLLKYEYWAIPVNYVERPWQRSMLLRAIWNLCTKEITRSALFPEFKRVDKEPALLGLRIIQAFKKDVEASGSKFLVVYLPHTPTLGMLLAGQEPTEADIIGELDKTAVVIHPEKELAEQIVKTPWRAAQFHHYSADENNVLGRKIAQVILGNRN